MLPRGRPLPHRARRDWKDSGPLRCVTGMSSNPVCKVHSTVDVPDGATDTNSMTSGNCRDSGRLRSCALPRRCRLERLLWPRVLHLRRHHCHRHYHRALRRKVLPQEQSREIVVKETVATRARQCQFNTNDD